MEDSGGGDPIAGENGCEWRTRRLAQKGGRRGVLEIGRRYDDDQSTTRRGTLLEQEKQRSATMVGGIAPTDHMREDEDESLRRRSRRGTSSLSSPRPRKNSHDIYVPNFRVVMGPNRRSFRFTELEFSQGDLPDVRQQSPKQQPLNNSNHEQILPENVQQSPILPVIDLGKNVAGSQDTGSASPEQSVAPPAVISAAVAISGSNGAETATLSPRSQRLAAKRHSSGSATRQAQLASSQADRIRSLPPAPLAQESDEKPSTGSQLRTAKLLEKKKALEAKKRRLLSRKGLIEEKLRTRRASCVDETTPPSTPPITPPTTPPITPPTSPPPQRKKKPFPSSLSEERLPRGKKDLHAQETRRAEDLEEEQQSLSDQCEYSQTVLGQESEGSEEQKEEEEDLVEEAQEGSAASSQEIEAEVIGSPNEAVAPDSSAEIGSAKKEEVPQDNFTVNKLVRRDTLTDILAFINDNGQVSTNAVDEGECYRVFPLLYTLTNDYNNSCTTSPTRRNQPRKGGRSRAAPTRHDGGCHSGAVWRDRCKLSTQQALGSIHIREPGRQLDPHDDAEAAEEGYNR